MLCERKGFRSPQLSCCHLTHDQGISSINVRPNLPNTKMSTPHIIHLANGRMKGDTDREQVRELIRHLMDHDGPGGAVIHFHGGLVGQAAGRKIAEDLDVVYREAGALPLFFVWEAGLLEVLKNNLGELAQEMLFEILWKRIVAIVKRKAMQTIGMKSMNTLPPMDTAISDAAIELALQGVSLEGIKLDELPAPENVDELGDKEQAALEAELAFDFPLVTEIKKVSAGLLTPQEIEQQEGSKGAAPIRSSTRSLMDPEAVERYVERPNANAKGLISTAKFIAGVVKIAARCIKRFKKGRDHGLHATVVEEILREFYVGNIGGTVWELMKKDTLDAFGPDPDVHGGTAFLTELRDALPEDHAPVLTLVGHSTGAIYIANLLEKAEQIFHDRPDVKFRVVFLAPAITFERCARMVEEHGHRISEIARPKLALRMFTMTDEMERKDRMLSVIYPHSLLYFVSGVIEKDDHGDKAIVGMERYYSDTRYPDDRFPEIVPFRRYIKGHDTSHDHHVVWSVVNADDGFSSSCESHGDFDNDPITRSSLKHLLKNGF